MPVRMKGNKLYRTVQERLRDAHGEEGPRVGIVSITTEAMAVGAAVVLRATVTFADGATFTGISQAQFDATSGADATNPVEVAETSAVGRALAFAGYYGSDDGIAGAEEVRQAQRRQVAAGPAAYPAGVPLPDAVRETPRAWYARVAPLARDRGIDAPPLTEDAPEAFVLDACRRLKAALQAA